MSKLFSRQWNAVFLFYGRLYVPSPPPPPPPAFLHLPWCVGSAWSRAVWLTWLSSLLEREGWERWGSFTWCRQYLVLCISLNCHQSHGNYIDARRSDVSSRCAWASPFSQKLYKPHPAHRSCTSPTLPTEVVQAPPFSQKLYKPRPFYRSSASSDALIKIIFLTRKDVWSKCLWSTTELVEVCHFVAPPWILPPSFSDLSAYELQQNWLWLEPLHGFFLPPCLI